MRSYAFADSPATLEAFLDDWHAGRLTRQDWTHGAHVAACAYYAFDHGADATARIMTAGILAFNRAVGVESTPTSGYHETLTRFWSTVIVAHVSALGAASRWDAVRSALDRYGEDRDLPRRCYSFDVVQDVRARREWVPPDRAGDGLLADLRVA
jgi:hypothetical protein